MGDCFVSRVLVCKKARFPAAVLEMSPRSSPEQTLFSRGGLRAAEIPGSLAHAILLGFSNSKACFSLVAWIKDDANKEMCYVQARLKLKIFEYCGIKRKRPLTLIVLKDLA